MASVDALAEFLEYYAAVKPELPRAWFALTEGIARDPDFVAMDQTALATIDDEGTWLEVKVLRQYFALFTESLGRARDVPSVESVLCRSGKQLAKLHHSNRIDLPQCDQHGKIPGERRADHRAARLTLRIPQRRRGLHDRHDGRAGTGAADRRKTDRER